MIYTAFVTPYEVAFLETKIDVLFVVNRIVDLGFVTDIWVQFHLEYLNKDGIRVYTQRFL